MLSLTTKEKTLIFDESGNMGTSGRYFVISCIETNNPKEIHNIVKKKLLKVKREFPNLKFQGRELKAAKALPLIKELILESVCNKDIKISYIVIDLKHIEPRLLKDKNLLYNYACKLLISRIVPSKLDGSLLNIWFDNHTTKVHSRNSFSDYIKIELIYNNHIVDDVQVCYIDSDAGDAYVVQAADYIANALYAKYEYGNNRYFNLIKSKLNICEHFPYDKFSK